MGERICLVPYKHDFLINVIFFACLQNRMCSNGSIGMPSTHKLYNIINKDGHSTQCRGQHSQCIMNRKTTAKLVSVDCHLNALHFIFMTMVMPFVLQYLCADIGSQC